MALSLLYGGIAHDCQVQNAAARSDPVREPTRGCEELLDAHSQACNRLILHQSHQSHAAHSAAAR
jgi:hypothetical protein